MLVLRVLNGPLFGAEVVLPKAGCFVRVVDVGTQPVDPAVEQGIDALAQGAVLTIPLAVPSPNFRLVSDVDELGATLSRVEIYDEESGVSEMPVEMNKPVVIGSLWIAVRDSSQVWTESVLRYRGGHEEPSGPGGVLPRRWRRRAAAAVLAVAAIVILAGGVWLNWSAPAPVANVSSLLADQAGQVVESTDHGVYVFVRDTRMAAGVRRLLAKAEIGDAQIRVREEEAARIGRWLEAASIHHFSVNLDDPRRPVLRLRRQMQAKALPALPADLEARLRILAPYVRGMKVQWLSEEDARRAARAVIEEVGARASYRVTPDHFVATIDDYLSDAQLDTFSRALAAYQRAWGEEYAQFQINQRDLMRIDGLKTGRLGYELRSSRHIYFPPD